MGNVHCWSIAPLSHCWTHHRPIPKINRAESRISPNFIPHVLLPFQNLAPILPTMHPGHWVTSLEAFYPTTCSFFWSHKRLHTTFFPIFPSWWSCPLSCLGRSTVRKKKIRLVNNETWMQTQRFIEYYWSALGEVVEYVLVSNGDCAVNRTFSSVCIHRGTLSFIWCCVSLLFVLHRALFLSSPPPEADIWPVSC